MASSSRRGLGRPAEGLASTRERKLRERSLDCNYFGSQTPQRILPYDGLLRKPKWYGGTASLKPNEAKERGLPQLKAIPARGPTADEVSAADVSEVIRLAVGASRGDPRVRVALNVVPSGEIGRAHV